MFKKRFLGVDKVFLAYYGLSWSTGFKIIIVG